MFRRIIEALFGSSTSNDPSTHTGKATEWRDPPKQTTIEDVGPIRVTMTITTGHHGFVSVVGESFCQEAIASVARRVGPGGVFKARLVPEPDNPYDSNAVAVCDDHSLQKLGHLGREVAKSYHARIARSAEPVRCPARLTGIGERNIGVVLDFEDARRTLGLPPVSVDLGDTNYEAVSEYHRLNNSNREFVSATKRLERSDTEQAIVRYKEAIVVLKNCRKLAESGGLIAHGFLLNQTDAVPIERLTMCLIRVGRPEEARRALDAFVEEFPHTHER